MEAERLCSNKDQMFQSLGLPASMAVISSQAFSIVNFRGALINELVMNGVQVWALAPDYTEKLREQVKKMGAEPVDYSLRRAGINPVRDLWDTFFLFRLLKKIKPEATLSYFIKPVIFGTIAAWLSKVPRRYALIEGLGFLFMDDQSAQTFYRKVLRYLAVSLYRFALKRCERVILLNPDDIRDLSVLKILPSDKASLIPGIGVDLSEFKQAPSVKEPVSFILIARMLKEKGVYDYVNAARMIKARHPEARFILVGGVDENPGSISTEELQTWHEKGVVEWTGQVSDVRKYLAQASVFVLPSYYREGVPRSTQEAMAMGLAVITTDVPGCRETVSDGVNGILVPVRCPEKLAAVMQRFIDDQDITVSMGEKSRLMAEEHFDVHKINRRFLEVFAASVKH